MFGWKTFKCPVALCVCVCAVPGLEAGCCCALGSKGLTGRGAAALCSSGRGSSVSGGVGAVWGRLGPRICAMSDVSEEALLEYFCSSGGGSGRVRNADLLKTFKPFIGHSDPQLRAKYREEFKLIIDRIAVVKSENGEKYLVLKKKYRQMLQERVGRHPRADVDGQRHASPARSPATAPWDATHTQAVSRRPHAAAEALQQVQHTEPSCPIIPVPNTAQSSREEDLDKDSGSKSESEQDEESTGSVGSAAVALDPIEKEWIYSAAGARVPDLSQLLRQDPSLANKKTSGTSAKEKLSAELFFASSSQTALHWAAKHGSRDMAALVADAGADVNSKSHVSTQRRPVGGFERAAPAAGFLFSGYTPLHIAALHGHQHILDLLVGTYGAKANLRDYSGHLALHYLKMKEPEGSEDYGELAFQVTQARDRNRNRKLASLFHSKKKWGSAEELAPIEEERTAPPQLVLPAFRPRKFSR
ncbi:Ankyrin repeat domain-containing protein SOWAHA [Takifugu flavidus]|uniref:Ankyrin repeat domain-containing protein SOWAHA n=1 Tax=Takifugu flavidus TaxID=433684 RepID=A0A5C6MQG7_9TELE|nr:Ankyrin repeat domain-containing protein SOWAHA [Takifugu flavidus]